MLLSLSIVYDELMFEMLRKRIAVSQMAISARMTNGTVNASAWPIVITFDKT
jgi:hypothetical protein